MRGKKLDGYVRDHLTGRDDPLVLHLGCGLDARAERVGADRGRWYDLDLPEVIDLRRRFLTETPGRRMIAASVTDHAWMDVVDGTGPAMIVAEGLLMYTCTSPRSARCSSGSASASRAARSPSTRSRRTWSAAWPGTRP
ncbi:MAG: hypothetical protein GEV11_22140 [Streptosporangiales bacterium]|nr:hypothetical protein [Streptosporangiales bacterium]